MIESEPHAGDRVENSAGTVRMLLLNPILAVFLLYVSIDVGMSARHMTAAAAPATLGFIILSAAALSGGAALALQAAIAMRRQVPRTVTRALAAAVVTWYPARWLSLMISSGSGISRSGWATAVRVLVLVSLLLAAAIAAGVLPALHQRLSRQRRALVGVVIIVLGFGALSVTSFHATTYIRAHRGILIVSALLLEIGLSFVLGSQVREGNRWRVHGLVLTVFAALVILGLALSRIGGSQRAYASYTVFSHTLVAQKLQSTLLHISPVFRSTSRVSLAAMRVASGNPVPIAPLPPGRYRSSNVLFVTFDALRADITSSRLRGHAVAPNLQALAASGASFENAISNYSHTSRSIFSILAASWSVSFPSEKYVSTDPTDVRARTRLPRLLRGAGYESVAIMMSGRWGEVFFDKDRFPEFDRHISAGAHCEAQVEAFRKYLTQRTDARPFWAWVHVFDTHTPLGGGSADQLFGDSALGRYAAAVHKGDRCLGQLVTALQNANEWKRTIVVVSADHGEALGEHGRTLQHSTCYWHDLHVPLVIRLPGAQGPRRIAYPIQPADLVPTLANLLGIHVGEPEVDGDDLSGLLDVGSRLPARDASLASMAFSQGHLEQYACASVVSGRWHLIYTEAARTYELYDVDADPHEEQNLAAERPDIFDKLQPVLDTFRERAASATQR